MNFLGKNLIKKVWRYPYCKLMRIRLKNWKFVILSSNCIGGCLLHDLGLPFTTPTINLFIPNFVRFVSNIDYYLQLTPRLEHNTEYDYPCFLLDDIRINAVHYKTEEEFQKAWNRRVERFNKKRIEGFQLIVIACDSQIQTQEEWELFERLPYKKVVFTSKMIEKQNFVYIKQFYGLECVGDMTMYSGLSGARIFEKEFDIIGFLNS